MRLTLDTYGSPLGDILLVSDGDGALRALDFADYGQRLRRLLRLHYSAYQLDLGPAPVAFVNALTAYFAGDLDAVAKLRVATGGTPFQREVWAALRRIPAGHTTTYGELAVELGRRGASRAVGLANGSNPIAIVVPCHRVIGSNGTLTGYAGGLPRKRWLLEHERRYSQRPSAERPTGAHQDAPALL
ncbi:MAG: methylated-DNA--[protein]-cysteine S-methyltransferase [Xanthobacteraceae bacterium]|nr:methylated-DNA--[protein]-cysteine S-methyltransferase [Xanthobacteraceae bacterium]